jgi:hypothetical protein
MFSAVSIVWLSGVFSHLRRCIFRSAGQDVGKNLKTKEILRLASPEFMALRFHAQTTRRETLQRGLRHELHPSRTFQ